MDGLPEVFRSAMQDLYDGKITAEYLHGPLLTHIAKELWAGVSIGFDTKYNAHDIESLHFRTIESLQKNVWVFSGFKTYKQLKEASLLLVDGDSNIKSFNEFLKDVQGINQIYNINYLRAEYENAIVGAQMIAKWQSYDNDAMLKFRATIDDRTTEICHSLNGLVKPKSWPGWKRYWLPLHWGERSNIIETVDDATDEVLGDLQEPKGMFDGNIAIDGVVFPDTHPYFGNVNSTTVNIIKNKVEKLSPSVKRSPSVTKADILNLIGRDIQFEASNIVLNDPVKVLAEFKNKAKGFNIKQLIDELDSVFAAQEPKWSQRVVKFHEENRFGTLFTVSLTGSVEDNTINIVRKFSSVNNELVVEHSLFTLPKTLQGSGISKGVLKAFYTQYKKLQVKRIEVHANITVGGYAWAKYGFSADRVYDATQILSDAKGRISDKDYNSAKRIYDAFLKKNPEGFNFPMNKWAEAPYGKQLLLNSDWNGNINLKNRKQKSIFEQYLGIK
jgi:hypothetical protein